MFTMFLLLLIFFYVLDIDDDLKEANRLKEEEMELNRRSRQRQERLLTDIRNENRKKNNISKKMVYRRSITNKDGVTYTEEVEKTGINQKQNKGTRRKYGKNF